MSVKPAIVLAAVAVVGLTGCQSLNKSLGLNKVVPDEFRIVTKAPLVVPPDYSLRPPAPGEPRPQELQPESAARAVLVGQVQAADRSPGENLLVARAGGANTDPLIRFVVDDENGAIAHKDASFAEKVMFWRKDQPDAAGQATAANTGANTPAPIDPAAEAAVLKGLTGNQPVVINRTRQSKLKLPGL
jgi:Protein of unknown function (DUF3035)